jgi:hypothetical protein
MQLDGVIPVFCLEDSKNPKGLKDGSEGHRLVEKTGPKDTVWLLLIGRFPPEVDSGGHMWRGSPVLLRYAMEALVSLVDYLSYFDYIKWSLLPYCVT